MQTNIIQTAESHPIELAPPNLYSLVIQLVAPQTGRLQTAMGQYANAAFYEILRAVDPTLAQEIHSWNGRLPFTISPLYGFGKSDERKQISIKAGQEGWMRLTLLDPRLFQTFISYVMEDPRQSTIRLHELEFQVTAILSHLDSHRYACTTSIDALYTHWMEKVLTPADLRINLHFKTPTAFAVRREKDERHLKRRMALMPTPTDVFVRLAEYWDSLQGVPTAEHVKLFAEKQIVVTRYDLKTQATLIKRKHQSGFVGKICYELFDEWADSANYIRHLNCLADLAFYSGLGSRTGMGMGQVVRF